MVCICDILSDLEFLRILELEMMFGGMVYMFLLYRVYNMKDSIFWSFCWF